MTDNLYNLKKRLRPEWYSNGPVKIFTREEIDLWEKEPHNELWAKITSQQGLRESDIKYLDNLALAQTEQDFNEILEGNSERGDNIDGIY